ncbi:hypothetical protein AGOR_G00093110 [Albula goreensis]|uniref:Ig-like domain-containing protein n=1 Tax=Albula goreensis TaxID=1534307 RepID=A0A8T3DK97_9TELE|nr:hypothetical protein AGOR_G00093110 [Albula goreensis]
MKKLLCIFTVFFAVPKSSQEKPEVTMHPEFKQVYSGDTVLLKCSGAGSVEWLLNGTRIPSSGHLYIPAISTNESGSYSCKRAGGESEPKIITVLEGLPIATLSIKSGQPVIAKGDSVVMELHVHSGLEGWYCKVYKGGRVRRINMLKNLMTRSNSYVQFQPKALNDTENPALYWCEHKTDNERSNPISIRITDLMVMLESFPDPAIEGKELKLKCYVWGDPVIRKTPVELRTKSPLKLRNSRSKVPYLRQSSP